jgi:hypothetical protein
LGGGFLQREWLISKGRFEPVGFVAQTFHCAFYLCHVPFCILLNNNQFVWRWHWRHFYTSLHIPTFRNFAFDSAVMNCVFWSV